MSVKKSARLEQWVLHDGGGKPQLAGFIYDDEAHRFPDGAWIYTSSVVTPIKYLCKGVVIQTMNTAYTLGESMKDNKAWRNDWRSEVQ